MKIRARLELLATANGGSVQPLKGSFRPNHRFVPDYFVIGEVQQTPDELIAPGDTADRIVNFLPEGLPPLTTGMQWELFDGPNRKIGCGTVLELLDA